MIVYLDQNKWIDLARAFYGKDNGKAFIPAMEDILLRSRRGEIIVPLSVVHFIETARAEDHDRRERLARFMVQLSGGYSVLPFGAAREAEVQQAIMRKLGHKPTVNIKDIVVRKGFDHAVGAELSITGVSDEVEKDLMNLLGQEETLVKLLVDAVDRQTAKDFMQEDIDVLVQLEESRRKQNEKLDKEMRLRLAIYEMATGGLIEMAVTQLKRFGLDPKKFADQLTTPEDWKSFFLDIPTMDVWINLNVLRDTAMGRPIHRNDTNDISFLSIAVPYCNIVVTEKFWTHLLKSNGYDKKYKCTVLDSVADLPDLLKKAIGT